MRTYTTLWVVWFVWALWILTGLYPDVIFITWTAILLTGGMLVLFLRKYALTGYHFMRLLKKRETKSAGKSTPNKSQTENATNVSEHNAAPISLPAEIQETLKPIKTRKDTFISPEAQLSGNLEGQGNIVIEGRLDGNIHCSHQVRIEPGGQVVGDIHAQHIIVNGKVEGRFYADAITLQSEGHIQGDIFTDALTIEKDGVFIGQSQLKSPEQLIEKKGNVTTLSISATTDAQIHKD